MAAAKKAADTEAKATVKKETKVKAPKVVEITEEQFEAREEVDEVPEGAEVFDEAVVVETPAEEKSEEPVEEIADAVEESVEEVAEESIEEAAAEEVNELEKTQELIEEFSHPEEKVEAIIKENPDDVKGALEKELKRVEDIEKKVSEEIKKNEAKLPKKKSRSNYGMFWNGVSDGWNN